MKYNCLPATPIFTVWRIPFALLFLLPQNGFAQNPSLVPQLEQELQEATSDSARAIALQDLAFNLAHSDPARSMKYGEEALRVAERTGNARVLSECQNGVGWAYFSRGNFTRARSLLDSSITYMRAVKDYFDLVPVCNNQGWVCLKQGDKLGALTYFREGLNAAEASGDAGRIAFMNRSLGSFYTAQKEYDKSIPHIKKASEMFAALGDSMQISECLISLGNAHSGLKEYETAIAYYKKALPFTQHSGDLLEEGMLYENWGLVLTELGRLEEAFSILNSARGLFEKLNEPIELASVENIISSTYLMKGDTTQAIAALEKARRLGTELQLTDILSEVLPALHKTYAAIGLPEKAYETLLAYQTMRDTAAVELRDRDLQRLQTEFETERKEKDLQIKTLENARLQSRFWLAFAALCVALMAGFAAWYRARQRRKTNAVLEAKNLEILAQKAEAERLRERAEHSEAVKEKFLAAMSHEIRTPMNAIVGLSQLLDAEHHEPTTARNISIIRQSGEHLMTILNDVLDLAKMEAQKIALRPQPMALLPHLELVRDTFAARAREKGLDLILDADDHLPKNVIADPVRLGQILNNLVSNAIKFTETGQVVISATLPNTPISQYPNIPISQYPNIPILFSVRDTGIGIAAENQTLIFEEFAQADSGIALRYGGTGLGLSIASSLVAQMGGILQLRSSPGEGSEFFFTLNLPPVDETQLQTPAEGKTNIPKLLCTAPVQILLVEDNEFNQAVASQTLAAICPEIQIVVADNGEAAIRIANTQNFDLILTDLQMPGLDGYETARRLRAAHFEWPIIALTASAVRTDEQKCREAGMEEMLFKPIAPSEMAALLLRYIPEKLAASTSHPPATALEESPPERPIPPSLLHYAGENQAIARQLLAVIRSELGEHLPALRALQNAWDDAGIRKKVHKMRPQLIALGLVEYKSLLDALEHNTGADQGFWENAKALEALLEKTLSTL